MVIVPAVVEAVPTSIDILPEAPAEEFPVSMETVPLTVELAVDKVVLAKALRVKSPTVVVRLLAALPVKLIAPPDEVKPPLAVNS
jgi:hypothetical protein